MVIEFNDETSYVFDKIMAVLKECSEYKYYQIKDESVLEVCGLEIHFNLRMVCYDHQKIDLTAKEYELLCALVLNKGVTLEYDRIYQLVWNEVPLGNTKNTVTCHIGNLRRKILKAAPNAQFAIKNIRSVGYRFEAT